MEKEFHSVGFEHNRSSEVMSVGPSVYTFETNYEHNDPVYPWAPTTHIQKHGAAVADNLIDIDSELMNITRKLSNNPQEQYQPGQGHQVKNKLKEGYFHQDSSRLTNNAFELRGTGWNRWEPLFFDPQKNSIEPFQRNGQNTVLATLDESLQCSVTNNNQDFNNEAAVVYENNSPKEPLILRDGPWKGGKYQLNQNPNQNLFFPQNEKVLSN